MDTAHPKRLARELYSAASQEQQSALSLLADAIEKVREKIRPLYGPARDYPRGFHAPGLDFVDTLSWEDVLTRHGAEVMVACVGGGYNPEYLIDSVYPYASSWATQDALMWMAACYRAIPIAQMETRVLALSEEHRRQREKLSDQGRARFKNAKRVALEQADAFLLAQIDTPTKVDTVRHIKEAVCDAARRLDGKRLQDKNVERTISDWLKTGIDSSRFKPRK